MQTNTSDRLLDRASLQDEKVPASTSSINRWVSKGEFPVPIVIGIKRFWWESEIDQYLADRKADALRRQQQKSAVNK